MMGDTINYYDLEFSLQSAFRLDFFYKKKFKISLVIKLNMILELSM